MDNKKFITRKVEMPIPYSIYSKIQKESIIWKVESRHTGNNIYIVQI